MTPNIDPLAELYDIEGIDSISWWPPAIGWWFVVIAAILLLAGITIIYLKRRTSDRGWQKNILRTLSEMEHGVFTQETAIKLSALIRHITIHQHSREACAGLEGTEWLRWLTDNDPEHFNWFENASWLITIPYAPPGTPFSESELRTAIGTIKKWIR